MHDLYEPLRHRSAQEEVVAIGIRKKQERAVIIYDGACPVCASAMEWVRENEADGAFEMVVCQEKGLECRFPAVTRTSCMEAIQLVLPDGAVLSGADALPEVLVRLRPRRYRGLSTLFRLPGVASVARPVYRWFAGRRYSIANLLGPGHRQEEENRSGDRKWQRKTS